MKISHDGFTVRFKTEPEEVFLRAITNIHFGGVILGKVIAIFSWQHKEKEVAEDGS
jgi:hypothetical protein